MNPVVTLQPQERIPAAVVLLVITMGLITIDLSIVAVIWSATWPHAGLFPNWAENVLVALASAITLKLGDCLSTLVALYAGKSIERLGTQLGNSAPVGPPIETDEEGKPKPVPVIVKNEKAEPVPTEAAEPAEPIEPGAPDAEPKAD